MHTKRSPLLATTRSAPRVNQTRSFSLSRLFKYRTLANKPCGVLGSLFLVGAGICGFVYLGVAQMVSRFSSAMRLSDTPTGTPLITTSEDTAMSSLYALGTVEDIDGVQRDLAEFAGNVSLVVNVASRCGYTDSNYIGLQALFEKYKERGFTVLAFPCNQFGRQEPQECPKIKAFVQERYNVAFPMFGKIQVNGPNVSPVYRFLKERLLGAEQRKDNFDLRWNFQKFLVNRDGIPVKLFSSDFDSLEIESAVEALL